MCQEYIGGGGGRRCTIYMYTYMFQISLVFEGQKLYMWDQVQDTQWIKIKSKPGQEQASKILA